MRNKCNKGRRTSNTTKNVRKGIAIQKARHKKKNGYGVGDFVLDCATKGGWSALRALGR